MPHACFRCLRAIVGQLKYILFIEFSIHDSGASLSLIFDELQLQRKSHSKLRGTHKQICFESIDFDFEMSETVGQ